MWIDTHCHADAPEFAADRSEILTNAARAGIGLVVPAVHRAAFEALAGLADQPASATMPPCWAAYGIHPLYVDQAGEGDLAALEARLASGSAVAVGEIGLDYFVEPRNEARQQAFFIAQLKLARQFDLPVILHVRKAIDPVLSALRRYRVRGGIAHAFNGSEVQAAEFIKLGFCLGFGGAMTWARALRIRALAARLPASAMVLETDAPDIPPEWIGKGRNTPAELPAIGAVLAGLRGETVAAVAAYTTENACRVLPVLGQSVLLK